MPIQEIPRFEHDCDNCKFLGHYHNHDLYFCGEQVIGGDTVIARYGNDGPEYSSGMYFARPDGIPTLFEAKKRAQELGYINN